MKNLKLNQLLDSVKVETFKELIHTKQSEFIASYQLATVLDEEVRLIFDTQVDAQTFYLDCQMGNRYLKNVGVYYDINDDKIINLRPIQSIISLLKGKDSSLLLLSKDLGLNFKLEYVQAFTNHQLELFVHEGQVVNPSCTLYYNELYPSFYLGRLYKLMNEETDFYALNTVIQPVTTEVIL